MSEDLDKHTVDQIDDFLAGRMNLDQRELFVQRLNTDPVLQKEVRFRSDLYTMMGSKDWPLQDGSVNSIRASLDSDQLNEASQPIKRAAGDYFEEQNRPKITLQPWLSIAIVAAGLALFFILSPKDKSLNDYYNDYHSWEQLPSLVEKGDQQNTLVKGELLFNKEQYQEVIESFESSYSKDAIWHPYALLYTAASYQELDQYSKAHEVYDQLIALESLESSRGLWFKCLLYLKQDDHFNASKMLSIITSDSQNYNYSKALELQKEIAN